MFDTFLTLVLQIIIVVDILAVIAYFFLGAFKPKAAKKSRLAVNPKPLWNRFLKRDQPTSAPSLDQAFGNLKRVLYSFDRGLA